MLHLYWLMFRLRIRNIIIPVWELICLLVKARVHYFILTAILICLICSLNRLLRLHIIIVHYISDLLLFVLLLWPSIIDILEKIVLTDMCLANDVMRVVRLIVDVLLNQLLQEIIVSLAFDELLKVYFWPLSLLLENPSRNYVVGRIRSLWRC